MKIIDKFSTCVLMATALLAGACTDDIERDPSPEVAPGCAQVYFENSNLQGKIELSPNDPTQLTVQVSRMNTEEEITVPIQVLTNTNNVFTDVPASVTFPAGTKTTSFTIHFDETELIKEYTLDLRVAGPHADPYTILPGTIGYTAIVQRIKWVSLGQGTFNYSMMYSGASRHDLEHGEGTDMYRLRGWGQGITLSFTASNEEATKFNIPEQLMGEVHPTYGDMLISGTVEFDGKWIYTFKIDYHVAEGSFGTGRETFVMDHQSDPSDFKATIAVDPTVNDATFTVTPNDNSIRYYVGCLETATAEKMDDKALGEGFQQLIEQRSEGDISGYLSRASFMGPYSDTFIELDPGTDYTIVAYAIDLKTAARQSDVTRQSFTTAADAVASEEYLAWVGTYTITSEKVFMNRNNAKQPVTEGPVSFEVTLSPKVNNASFNMTAWTINPTLNKLKLTAKYDAANDALLIPSYQNMGELEEGIDLYFEAYMESSDSQMGISPVGGNYDGFTINKKGGAYEFVGYESELDGGGTFKVVGMDFFGKDPQYVYFLSFDQEGKEYGYAVGPYTMVKKAEEPASVATSAARLKSMRKSTRPGKIGMSFSSATPMMQAR